MTSRAKDGSGPFADERQAVSRPGGASEAAASRANTAEPTLSWDERTPEIPLSDADKLLNRSKILLAVDDDGENLAIIEKIARSVGYTFFGASNGEECVSLAQRVVPRLILLDVQMPGINGYETCRLLRTNNYLAHIPITFLTARKTHDDVRKSMAVGGNDFIIKPFDPVKLRERINYWMLRGVRVRATRR